MCVCVCCVCVCCVCVSTCSKIESTLHTYVLPPLSLRLHVSKVKAAVHMVSILACGRDNIRTYAYMY